MGPRKKLRDLRLEFSSDIEVPSCRGSIHNKITMKTALNRWFCLAFTGIHLSGSAQGTFGNLGFESAIVPYLPPGQSAFVEFTNVFPGWTGYYGTNVADSAIYNSISLGAAFASLI